MSDPENALRAALEAAGLSLHAIPEEQRGMFTSLSDEEVTRLITLFGGQPASGGGRGGTETDLAPPDPTTAVQPGEPTAVMPGQPTAAEPGEPAAAAMPSQPTAAMPGQPTAASVDPDGLDVEDPANGAR